MDDRDILRHIDRLVDEEHALFQKSEQERGLSEAEHGRLQELGVALDQLWDLLRQRRARREAGLDPDAAKMRDAGTVEGYTA
jgi:hypothetical protein